MLSLSMPSRDACMVFRMKPSRANSAARMNQSASVRAVFFPRSFILSRKVLILAKLVRSAS